VKKSTEFNSSKDERVAKWKDKKICGQPDIIKSTQHKTVSKGDQIQNHINNLNSNKNENANAKDNANNIDKMELPKTIHHQGMSDN